MSVAQTKFDDAGVLPPAARALIDAPRTAPRVLHIDHDAMAALALAVLLTPEARLCHVSSLQAARAKLRQHNYALVIIDPEHLDGDLVGLLELLVNTPLLVYSAQEPPWQQFADDYLPKPWTSPRRLWGSVAHALGMPSPIFVGA